MTKERTLVRLRRDLMLYGRKRSSGDWVSVDDRTLDRLLKRDFADLGDDWGNPAGANHVLMVSDHACTRVCKQASALKALGWRVDSLSRSIPKMPDAFDVLQVTMDLAEFPELIRRNGAKIIHVHNEPDALMRLADEGCEGRPIVYDCHDLEWYRTFSVGPEEEFAFKRADGIVHVSEEHRALAWKLHRWDAPDVVTMSVPMMAWMPPRANDTTHRKGVVYEGGSHPGATTANRFRDHTVVARKFKNAGVQFHIYAPTRAMGAYDGAARMMVPYERLITDVLPTYRWGFMGTDIKTDKGDVCLPNKTFEYAMCGLPILGCNVPAVEKFMGGEGGIFDKDMDRLIDRMKKADWLEMHNEVVNRRRFMEDEIKNTLRVYDAVTGRWKCEFCGKDSFKNELGLHGHMKSAHPEEYAAVRAAK